LAEGRYYFYVGTNSSHEKKLAVTYAVERTHFSKNRAASLYEDTYKKCLKELSELESPL